MSLRKVSTLDRASETSDDGMLHMATTCCPPYTETLCGKPITSDMDQRSGPLDCVVCADLRNQPCCPRCGR